MDFRTSPVLTANAERGAPDTHIVDDLIGERSLKLSRHPLWPLSGRDAMEHVSRLLALDLKVEGLENIPREGGFILAPNHPTGIADGVAVFDALKERRADMAIFANRDALRVSPGFRDLMIPVEWREGEKSYGKSRDTLEATARAFAENRAVVLFPSGRIAYWNDGALTERPWQTSAVVLARRYRVPVVPAHIRARNSGLFYFFAKHSTELRDITLFHELLNKKRFGFSMTFGRPVDPAGLDGDPAEVTARLQQHTVEALRADPRAEFG